MDTILIPSLQEAADALISNLMASEPLIRYQQAMALYNQDEPARTLLEQLSQVQASARQAQASGSVTQANIAVLRTLQAQVQGNPVIMEYAQAQQEAVNYLREINTEISQLLGIDFASFTNRAIC